MSIVLPGVAEVMANLGLRVSMLMRLDFPTLERPMNAYSGSPSCGQRRMPVLLMTNEALFISMTFLVFTVAFLFFPDKGMLFLPIILIFAL